MLRRAPAAISRRARALLESIRVGRHVPAYALSVLSRPDPLLEPQDGPVHLRPSQQDPHHQPGKRFRCSRADKFVRQLTARRGTILMVGTKRQARETVAAEANARRAYVDQRWLGGMLTNFKTVKTSIKRLKDMRPSREAGWPA